jgi:hypothetical protein
MQVKFIQTNAMPCSALLMMTWQVLIFNLVITPGVLQHFPLKRNLVPRFKVLG